MNSGLIRLTRIGGKFEERRDSERSRERMSRQRTRDQLTSQTIASDQVHLENTVVNLGDENDRPPIGDYGSARPVR